MSLNTKMEITKKSLITSNNFGGYFIWCIEQNQWDLHILVDHTTLKTTHKCVNCQSELTTMFGRWLILYTEINSK